MFRPRFVHGLPFERSAGDDALRLRTIDNLPRLTDAFASGKVFFEKLGQFAPTPDSFLKNRFKTKRRI